MPTYTMKNKQTGEVKDMYLSFSERDELLSQGEWTQELSTASFVTGVRSPLRQAGSEWRNHLTRIKNSSGRNNTIKD